MVNVLVVDDEADILKLISENLQIRGFRVAQAQTATDALVHISGEKPALLVLDIKLPDFTGWELLRRIQDDPQIESDFPVLIMTASITDANMDLREYPTVVEVLIKPFTTSKLISSVRQSIESYSKKE